MKRLIVAKFHTAGDPSDVLKEAIYSLKGNNEELFSDLCEPIFARVLQEDDRFFYKDTENSFWEIDEEILWTFQYLMALIYLRSLGNTEKAYAMLTKFEFSVTELCRAALSRTQDKSSRAELIIKRLSKFDEQAMLALAALKFGSFQNKDITDVIDDLISNYDKEVFNVQEQVVESWLQGIRLRSVFGESDKLWADVYVICYDLVLNDKLPKKQVIKKNGELLDENSSKIYALEMKKYFEQLSLQKIDYSLPLKYRELKSSLTEVSQRNLAMESLINLANEGDEIACFLLADDALKRNNPIEADHWIKKKHEIYPGNKNNRGTAAAATGVAASAATGYQVGYINYETETVESDVDSTDLGDFF